MNALPLQKYSRRQQKQHRPQCSIAYTLLILLLSTTMPTTTFSQSPPQNTSQKKPLAVLHVGPHKTGTTSIQETTNSYSDIFAKDKYIVLDFDKTILNLRQKRHSPAKNIAFCSCPYYADEHSKYCSIAYYNEAKKLLSDPSAPIFQNMNLLLSHESYDKECIEIDTLRSIFQQWEVRIIVGYRRYFDWAVSLYGEDHRVELLPGWENRADKFKRGRGQEWDEQKAPYESLKRWLTLHWMEYHYAEGKYTTAIVQRFAKVFGEDAISIINMHEEGINVVENFICDKVPNADKTCKAFRNAKVHEKNAHVAASNAYDHIAVEAYNAGFLSGKKLSRPEARELIKQYQEVTLGLTVNDFPKDCLEEEELERLLELSMNAEKEIVPDFFALEDVGKNDLKEKFQVAKTTKLCGVDTEALFQDEKWKSFLNSLEQSNDDEKTEQVDKKGAEDSKTADKKVKDDRKDSGDKADDYTNDKVNDKGNSTNKPETKKNSNNESNKKPTTEPATTHKTEKDSQKSTLVQSEGRAHSSQNTISTPTSSKDENTSNDALAQQEQEEERKYRLTLEFASSIVIIILVIISSIRSKIHRGKKSDDTKLNKAVEAQGLLTPKRLSAV